MRLGNIIDIAVTSIWFIVTIALLFLFVYNDTGIFANLSASDTAIVIVGGAMLVLAGLLKMLHRYLPIHFYASFGKKERS